MDAATTVSLSQSIGYGTMVHVALWLLVCLHLLLKPRDARTSLLWIFFTSIFPIVGPFAYVLFGINTVPNKGWQKQYSDTTFQKRQRLTSRSTHPLAAMHTRRNALRATLDDRMLAPFNRILDHLSGNHPLLGGNDIQLLEPAGLALEAMFLALREARHHIHLSTYIFNDDAVGQRLMNLLVEKARAGVEVRVLYDAFGSAGANIRLFFWRHRREPNLEIIGFSQANVLKRKFQLNLRNHRKILVIDGVVAYTGGINFHDVYLSRGNRPGTLDYHFRVKGPAVLELQYTFLRDWYYMTDQPPEKLLAKCYFPAPAAAGEMAVRLLNSGPTREETAAAMHGFFAALNLARRQVLIVTPYFVPPEALILALRQAAFRGVEVKVLVPSVNNHPTLQFASQALYAELLVSGVRIFERAPPFIHAKAAVIDDVVAIIGSANFDPRSLFLNYETNLVVFNESCAARVKAAVLNDLSQAVEIHYADWRRRPLWRKFVENFFNLFHPIA
ncbi:MAG: cardiolipin synthase [Kiritimatiellae bacterium]|jgi:cardiolipin synthase|nr:cardiolipin synthase [Kiritimatiellia bacterium]MDX9795045.1 cardiolipin synthase [Kiritimatiellia bacterium]HQL50549.1 cardiolipin synthase [Kiritimatiellia bacterium]